ncbi:hypothetical protein ACVWW1_001289 [Bradyrhizobium sp. JR3.5]
MLHIDVRMANRAGDQPRIGGKIFSDAHIDQRRRVRRADQPCQFFKGDRGIR